MVALEIRVLGRPSVSRNGTMALEIEIPNGPRAAVTLEAPAGSGLLAERAIASPSGKATLAVRADDLPAQGSVRVRLVAEGFDGVGRGEAPLEIEIRGQPGEIDTSFGEKGFAKFTVEPRAIALRDGGLFAVDQGVGFDDVLALDDRGARDVTFGNAGACRPNIGGAAVDLVTVGGAPLVFSQQRGVLLGKGCSVALERPFPAGLGIMGGRALPSGRVIYFMDPREGPIAHIPDEAGISSRWGVGGSLSRLPEDKDRTILGWVEGPTFDQAFVRRSYSDPPTRRNVSKGGQYIAGAARTYPGLSTAYAVLDDGPTVVGLAQARSGVGTVEFHVADTPPVTIELPVPFMIGPHSGHTIAVRSPSRGGPLVVVPTGSSELALFQFTKDLALDPTFGPGGTARPRLAEEIGMQTVPLKLLATERHLYALVSAGSPRLGSRTFLVRLWL